MRIPKQAKRVFKGVIFDVYQWPQKMFDGSYETFEMLKRQGAVQVIPVTGNKILINKQRQPNHKKFYYSFFGGRMDKKGESPLQTAKRELLEESGYTSNQWIFYKKYQPHPKFDWTVYFYIALDCKKINKQNLDKGEKINIISLSFDEFIDTVIKQDFFAKDFVLDVLKLKLKGKLNQFKKQLFKK